MLKCSEIVELGSDYLDHETRLAKRLQIRLHLMLCRHCRRFVQQMKLTIETVNALPESEESMEKIEQQAEKLRHLQRENPS